MQTHDYSKPKNGNRFKVIGVARISTDNQNELSLDDQEAYYREWLDREYGDGQYELRVIAYRGSGQILDHREFLELCDLVASGDYDLVIAEDLSRIIRRMQAVIFCEEAEDTATRVIGIGDPLDTAQEGWEQTAVFVSLKNSAFCKDTSRRIRRSHRNRFMNGGIVMCIQYGYIKPHPKASDDEVQKDPDAETVYENWISMLEKKATYAEVARWLQQKKNPTGPYCSSQKWTGAMVKRLTCNPILKGERHRNKKVTKRINKTGRAKSVDAPPEELLVRQVPHLAFVEPDRWDRLIRQLDKRNKKYRRSAEQRNDPRAGIPKKQTRWPGQHIHCGVCGRLFVFGGHGRKERLMCNRAREYQCWNAMTISGPEVAEAVGIELQELIQALPDFDRHWVNEYEAQRAELMGAQDSELAALRKQLKKESRALENYLEALGQLKSSSAILNKINDCEAKVDDLNDKIFALEKTKEANPELPSLEEIQREASAAFSDMANESEEFGRLMRNVVTEFFVLPYRLADGGEVQPRIRFRASLGALVG